MMKYIFFRMASQMVFSGTAGCPAFNPNPWKADMCQVMFQDKGLDEKIMVGIKCYQGNIIQMAKSKGDNTNGDCEDHCYEAVMIQMKQC